MARDAGSRAPGPDARERLRSLPSVEELAASLERGVPHALAVRAAREAIAARRAALRRRRRRAAGDLPTMRAPALGGRRGRACAGC